MTKRRRGAEWRRSRKAVADVPAGDEADDPFEAWERYPVHEAEENIGYQKLAWYAAPFGDAGVALLILAAVGNGIRRVGRTFIRLLMR